MNYLEIGNRIRAQRELLGITREELAELLDLTPRFCYDIELGNKGMSVETLCRCSEVLRLPADYLLFGDTEYDEGVIQCISVIRKCPVSKRAHLSRMMSEFVQALTE